MIARPTHPAGTGYEIDLYKIPGSNDPSAHWFEVAFAQKLDAAASTALINLKIGVLNQTGLDAWCNFIMSLWMRTPEDITALRLAYKNAWLNESLDLQEKYSQLRTEEYPENVLDYHEQMKPGWFDHSMLKMGTKLMTHFDIGALLSKMRWCIINTDKSEYSLLTSDRPILRPANLTESDAYLIMPIGPYKVFIAATEQITIDKILNKSCTKLVEIINHQISQHAVKFVYGKDDSHLRFVNRRIGTQVYSSVFEQFLKK